MDEVGWLKRSLNKLWIKKKVWIGFECSHLKQAMGAAAKQTVTIVAHGGTKMCIYLRSGTWGPKGWEPLV